VVNSELITVRQAAELLGNTVQHVRLLIRTGQLTANKVGRDWIVDRDAVVDVRMKRATPPLIILKKRGRPPAATLVRESGNEYPLERAIPDLKVVSLADQAKHNVREQEDSQALIRDNGSQLAMEMEEERHIASFTEFTDIKVKIDPRNKLNELTAMEWLPETVSV
jgi:excisionase family DNA binding protein